MHSRILLAGILTALVTLISCSGGGGGGGGSEQGQQDPGGTTGGSGGGTTGGSGGGTTGGTGGGTSGGGRPAQLVYDSELSSSQAAALDRGTAKLGAIQFNNISNSRFSQVFGGNRSSNVVNYFETRVNYGFSEDTDLDARLSDNLSFTQQIVAFNPSSRYWFLSLVAEQDGIDLHIQINYQLVEIDSSRIGLMVFGDIFVSQDPIEQAVVMVHEARHTDCTGGVTVSDVNRRLSNVEMSDPRCGHIHTICPLGKPEAGILACDKHPWGAYSVSAIYGFAISENCTNCTQVEKTKAEAWAMISVNRLVPAYSDLINGVYGSPNMSNSTQVRNE